jgi:hypothetical protein
MRGVLRKTIRRIFFARAKGCIGSKVPWVRWRNYTVSTVPSTPGYGRKRKVRRDLHPHVFQQPVRLNCLEALPQHCFARTQLLATIASAKKLYTQALSAHISRVYRTLSTCIRWTFFPPNLASLQIRNYVDDPPVKIPRQSWLRRERWATWQ